MGLRLNPDFKEFLKLLNENHVDYLLVGGYAVNIYGYSRTTGDMDIWIRASLANASRVVDVLRDFGFGQNLPSLDSLLHEDTLIRMGIAPVRLELFTSLSGLDFDSSFNNSSVHVLDGIEVRLISLEDLKVNKRASGRHKDLADLENLP